MRQTEQSSLKLNLIPYFAKHFSDKNCDSLTKKTSYSCSSGVEYLLSMLKALSISTAKM